MEVSPRYKGYLPLWHSIWMDADSAGFRICYVVKGILYDVKFIYKPWFTYQLLWAKFLLFWQNLFPIFVCPLKTLCWRLYAYFCLYMHICTSLQSLCYWPYVLQHTDI